MQFKDSPTGIWALSCFLGALGEAKKWKRFLLSFGAINRLETMPYIIKYVSTEAMCLWEFQKEKARRLALGVITWADIWALVWHSAKALSMTRHFIKWRGSSERWSILPKVTQLASKAGIQTPEPVSLSLFTHLTFAQVKWHVQSHTAGQQFQSKSTMPFHF